MPKILPRKTIEELLEVAREASRRWKANNAERVREYKRKYRAEHREQERERDRKWRTKNLERAREYDREYSKQYYAKNPDKHNALMSAWLSKHPEKATEYNHKRRARKLENGGVITAKEWRDLKKKYNNTCLCCGRQEPEIKLTLDHVLPLVLGGTNTIDNAQPLCGTCNYKKQSKFIDYR